MIDLELVTSLYRKHVAELGEIGAQQREFARANAETMTPQLDDLEAEITYLLLREYRPAQVMELGTFHGWSTTWLLSALRDNDTGHLTSFDKIDNVRRNVPAELAADRWTFVRGDMQDNLGRVPADTAYLFVDADHGRRFGRWYLEHLFPAVPPGIPVSVHDVFRGRGPRVWSEGAEVVRWLAERRVAYFTTSRAHAPSVFAELTALRGELGLADVRGTTRNPMLWFTMP